MKRLIIALCIILLLCGCTNTAKPNETASTTVTTENLIATESTPLHNEPIQTLTCVSVPSTTEEFCLEDGTELFSYSYQHMDMIYQYPEIANKIILEFLNRVDRSQSQAKNILETAKSDYTETEDWIPYFYRVVYSPSRIDGSVLSLSGIQNSYTGGLHGNISCISANYDMATGDVLTFGSIMHADAAVDDFVELILADLHKSADSYYLYDDFEVAVRERFSGDENLYEDFYFTANGLCFYFSPYEIAPYSSGIIVVELPYSDLPGLIYDGYFPPEKETVEGKLVCGTFMDTDMEQFNNMAEVIVSTGEALYVVYPEGTVEDVQIHLSGDNMTVPDYTLFQAERMTDQDAVVLHLPDDLSGRITVTYSSNAERFEIALVA